RDALGRGRRADPGQARRTGGARGAARVRRDVRRPLLDHVRRGARRRAMRLGISTRLAGATALLIVAIVGVMVWQWASTERQIVRQQKRDEARAFAVAMADVLMNELDDENWAQIRVS